MFLSLNPHAVYLITTQNEKNIAHFSTLANLMDIDEYVVVQFYPWFKFYFRLSWLFLMYDNEFETKENKI